MSNNEAPEKPDIWLACAEANKDDLRECAVYLEGGWKSDEDWHYVPVERIAELESRLRGLEDVNRFLMVQRLALKNQVRTKQAVIDKLDPNRRALQLQGPDHE